MRDSINESKQCMAVKRFGLFSQSKKLDSKLVITDKLDATVPAQNFNDVVDPVLREKNLNSTRQQFCEDNAKIEEVAKQVNVEFKE